MADAGQIYEAMRKSIEEYDSDAAVAAAESAIAAGLDLLEAVEKGFANPIRELGEAFDRMEIFLPELTLGADAIPLAGFDRQRRGLHILSVPGAHVAALNGRILVPLGAESGLVVSAGGGAAVPG